MFKNRENTIILILVLFLSIFSISLFAQSTSKVAYSKNYEIIVKILQRLNVPKLKIKKIVEIYKDTDKKVTPVRFELQKAQIDFQQEYIKENPNIDKLKKIIFDMAKLEAQIKIIQLQGELQVRNILGDDLFFQFKDALQKLQKQINKKKTNS